MNMAGKWAASTKTGPNDRRVVIWAISEFVFYYFDVSLYLLTKCIEYSSYITNMVGKRAVSTKTGSNDHLTVVWAISGVFLIFISFFFDTN